jgi:DNA-binding CsgD family transcriptional regulator
MNTSITYNDLSKIEREIADMYISGYTKKEIAAYRDRSYFTINNQIDKLFKKTEVRKDTEFACWYFVTRFHISFDLSPLRRAVISIFLLTILTASTILESSPFYRVRSIRARTTRTEQVRRVRRVRRNDDYEFDYELIR